MTKIKTRFAPSPTGALHIGGARTALFSWLYAKHTGGEYCVRIEDTDKERSTPENMEIIKRDLKWLGLEPDGDYVLQSKNVEFHKKAVQTLLGQGHAYEDDGAVRFKVPAGETSWHDAVQGKITYQNEQLEDFVIQRSDGTPTYHLAVVADDAAMAITHVIRGDDHINNTPKQILLYKALGHSMPVFGHVPLIHGADGKKMSKRHGATSAEDFKKAGILPAALVNYLIRLGWSLGDEEIIPLTRAIEKFDLVDVNKGASVFDTKKLEWLNAHYIKEMPAEEIIPLLESFCTFAEGQQKQWLLAGLPSLKERAKTLVELAELSKIYTTLPPFELNEKEAEILSNGRKVVADFKQKLSALTTWKDEQIHHALQNFVEESGLKFKDVGQPVRLALTGKLGGPSLSEIMVIFGREETLNRLGL